MSKHGSKILREVHCDRYTDERTMSDGKKYTFNAFNDGTWCLVDSETGEAYPGLVIWETEESICFFEVETIE